MTAWGLTIDCTEPRRLADFWALALGYEEPAPPEGFATWAARHAAAGVPEEERDGAAYLVDPAGVGPTVSLLRVPEAKAVKNRLHIDVKAGGGRGRPWAERWPDVLRTVERLTAAGATVLEQVDGEDGRGDHVVMADPEGNEFCVL